MGTITLTLPVAGTVVTAGLIANDMSTIQTLANGNIDTNNLAAGAGVKGSQLATGITGAPGTQLDYVEFTADVTSTATTAATAVTVVTGSSVAYDGATAVWVEFFAPYGINIAGQLLNLELYDGASAIGTLGSIGAAAAIDGGLSVRRRLTPSNASHTYAVKAWNSGAGTGTVKAGAGGSGVLMPGHITIRKA